jgi:hypothetical protein
MNRPENWTPERLEQAAIIELVRQHDRARPAQVLDLSRIPARELHRLRIGGIGNITAIKVESE